MIAVLHDIRSTHNVGSIFRTADAAGVKKIFLCGITPGPLDRFGRINQKLTKVSLGAERSMVWRREQSTIDALAHLKTEGYSLIAVEQSPDSVPYHEHRLTLETWHKTALILGSEIYGLPKEILDSADTILEISMKGEKESLNVSVAFGIVLFNRIGISIFQPKLKNHHC